MNLKIIGKMKLSNICFLIVFFTSAAFSQVKTTIYPKIIVYDKDTVILFSIDQAKKLAESNPEKIKEYRRTAYLKRKEKMKNENIKEN